MRSSEDQEEERTKPQPSLRPVDAGVLERLAGREHRFNRYELQGELARGGQGAVLRVWDRDLRRNLAMKIVLGGPAASCAKPNTDAKSLGRFLEEAQVTGQLDHPGIVPVHELGLDRDGRVFFTMKLVKGQHLGEVFELMRAGREGWTRPRVLGVLLKVCEAMSYAHAKAVVHRDLKPANIMVGRYGETYVMDWGLAHVGGTEDDKDLRVCPEPSSVASVIRSDRREPSADDALLTMDGEVVGTPAYMSPEQACGDLARMGPASDVYALGAILYHLLAGHMPYAPHGSRLNAHAIWGLVQNGPPRPIVELARDAPPELVSICEKAMAREPEERYSDMGELAEDLRAFVENRVVSAHRSGAVIELRKWIQRNRALAITAAALVVSILAGSTTAAIVLGAKNESIQKARDQALAARDRADAAAANEARLRLRADTAQAEAEAARAASERVTDFLVDQFEALDPKGPSGSFVPVMTLLDNAVAALDSELGMSREEATRLRGILGDAYFALSQYSSAQPLLEQALEERRELFGARHPDTLAVATSLGQLHAYKGEYSQAEGYFQQVLDVRRQTYGQEDPATLVALMELGQVWSYGGRYTEAEEALELAVDGLERARGPRDPETLDAKGVLANLYNLTSRWAEAEELHSRVLNDRREVLGPEDERTLASELNLALALNGRHRHAESAQLLDNVLEACCRLYGEDHRITLHTRFNLSVVYEALGREDEAREQLLETHRRGRTLFGADDQLVRSAAVNLAHSYRREGQFAEAEQVYLQTLEGLRVEPPGVGWAAPSWKEVDTEPRADQFADMLDDLYSVWLERLQRDHGGEHPDTLDVQARQASLLADCGRLAEAEATLRACVDGYLNLYGPSNATTLSSFHAWASVIAHQGRSKEAEAIFLECLDGRRALLGDRDADTLATTEALVRLYCGDRRWVEAKPYAAELLEATPPTSPDYARRREILELVEAEREER